MQLKRKKKTRRKKRRGKITDGECVPCSPNDSEVNKARPILVNFPLPEGFLL